MNILGNNKDKFGYYQIGDFKTYSKVEAIELHKRTGIHPHWNFNEHEFGAYNWQIEPQESLQELYARRAMQIREDYDYVVLFYSGGADSSNILDTFLENNIAFDELATFNYLSADSNPNSFFNSEQIKVSYPRIKQLQAQGVKFKHRVVDLSDVASNILSNDHYRNNRAYYASAHWGTSHLSKSYIRETTPDYQKLIEQGKKVVFVWGCDKPRLYRENNRYCVKFLDVIDAGLSSRTQIVNREYEYDELFYWAPETADIVCKQAHILKRFFEKHKIYKEDKYYSDTLIDLPDIEHIFANKHTEDGLSYRNLINTLIYPNFSAKTFSAGKPISVVASHRDVVWNKDSWYQTQLTRLKSHLMQLDPYWFNDANDIEKGIKCCISPAYYLE